MASFSDTDQAFMNGIMNEHEIDKAIRRAIGLRDFDPRIREMWRRVLNKPQGARDRQFLNQGSKAKWHKIPG